MKAYSSSPSTQLNQRWFYPKNMPIDVTGTEPVTATHPTIDCPFCKQDTHRTMAPFVCPNCNKWVTSYELAPKPYSAAPLAPTPPKPPPPESIVCPSCKEETGKKPADLLLEFIIRDFLCPMCGSVVFSCRPEVKTYSYVYDRNAFD